MAATGVLENAGTAKPVLLIWVLGLILGPIDIAIDAVPNFDLRLEPDAFGKRNVSGKALDLSGASVAVLDPGTELVRNILDDVPHPGIFPAGKIDGLTTQGWSS